MYIVPIVVTPEGPDKRTRTFFHTFLASHARESARRFAQHSSHHAGVRCLVALRRQLADEGVAEAAHVGVVSLVRACPNDRNYGTFPARVPTIDHWSATHSQKPNGESQIASLVIGRCDARKTSQSTRATEPLARVTRLPPPTRECIDSTGLVVLNFPIEWSRDWHKRASRPTLEENALRSNAALSEPLSIVAKSRKRDRRNSTDRDTSFKTTNRYRPWTKLSARDVHTCWCPPHQLDPVLAGLFELQRTVPRSRRVGRL